MKRNTSAPNSPRENLCSNLKDEILMVSLSAYLVSYHLAVSKLVYLLDAGPTLGLLPFRIGQLAAINMGFNIGILILLLVRYFSKKIFQKRFLLVSDSKTISLCRGLVRGSLRFMLLAYVFGHLERELEKTLSFLMLALVVTYMSEALILSKELLWQEFLGQSKVIKKDERAIEK